VKAPDLQPASEMMAVGIAHRTRYVRTLYPISRESQSGAAANTLADYGELKRPPHIGGKQKSMFDR